MIAAEKLSFILMCLFLYQRIYPPLYFGNSVYGRKLKPKPKSKLKLKKPKTTTKNK